MKKRKGMIIFAFLTLVIVCWSVISADAPGQAISAISLSGVEAHTFSLGTTPSPLQKGQIQESAVSFASFDHQTVCTEAGWKWNGSGTLMWCESYVPCGQPAPTCPGTPDNWDSVVDSSRICRSVKTSGYRVYCHVESSE